MITLKRKLWISSHHTNRVKTIQNNSKLIRKIFISACADIYIVIYVLMKEHYQITTRINCDGMKLIRYSKIYQDILYIDPKLANRGILKVGP